MKFFRKLIKKVYSFIRLLVMIRSRGLKIILPALYLFIATSGFFLTLLSYFIPKMISCIHIYGNKVCTPLGVIISSMSSFPGYLLIGGIFGSLVTKIPIAISFFLVVGISTLIYFIIGLLADNLLQGKFFPKLTLPKLIFAVFILLLFFLLLLSL